MAGRQQQLQKHRRSKELVSSPCDLSLASAGEGRCGTRSFVFLAATKAQSTGINSEATWLSCLLWSCSPRLVRRDLYGLQHKNNGILFLDSVFIRHVCSAFHPFVQQTPLLRGGTWVGSWRCRGAFVTWILVPSRSSKELTIKPIELTSKNANKRECGDRFNTATKRPRRTARV